MTTEDDKPDTGTDKPPEPDKDSSEVEKWKALARKHEKQAKENSDAAKRLAELEDANKSELEKATERVAEAERRAQAAENNVLRYEIAATKGLSPAQAKRLVGSTKEELEADADEILEAFKPADDTPMPGKPTADLKGGGDPTEEPEVNVREVIDSIPRGV